MFVLGIATDNNPPAQPSICVISTGTQDQMTALKAAITGALVDNLPSTPEALEPQFRVVATEAKVSPGQAMTPLVNVYKPV